MYIYIHMCVYMCIYMHQWKKWGIHFWADTVKSCLNWVKGGEMWTGSVFSILLSLSWNTSRMWFHILLTLSWNTWYFQARETVISFVAELHKPRIQFCFYRMHHKPGIMQLSLCLISFLTYCIVYVSACACMSAFVCFYGYTLPTQRSEHHLCWWVLSFN